MTGITSPAPHAFRFAGLDLVADPSGALFWPGVGGGAGAGIVAVADLHLEKGSRGAARGHPLPPYDTRATLDRLEAVIGRLRPSRVICVGDSFHDGEAGERMAEADARRLRALVGAFDWVWISGNHDPRIPPDLGGRCLDELRLAPLVFRHEARPGALCEVSGHLHPTATIAAGCRRVRGRCFVTDGAKLILPAFGAYAGGLDVRVPAVRGLLRPRFEVHVLAGDRVHRFPDRSLV